MTFCPNCGTTLEDNAQFCKSCGFVMAQQQAAPNVGYAAPMPQPVYNPTDHTAEFTAEDISNNKVLAMMPYLTGFIGIVIALLAINHSKFVAFHVKEALKIQVASTLLSLLTVLLCWTFIVPIAGGICFIILFVVKIICFFNVCGGKAKEAPIISGLKFLK